LVLGAKVLGVTLHETLKIHPVTALGRDKIGLHFHGVTHVEVNRGELLFD